MNLNLKVYVSFFIYDLFLLDLKQSKKIVFCHQKYPLTSKPQKKQNIQVNP